ncbi:hypothetical protein I551_7908 [Mycobacterium ulcerans str. Harvey]|uniref:Uncharacterized protein n=1 Tax=Mycobacterium ulcerans str. Harvey TaxID=1299332 RepID=A0ABN0QLV9_MYCUL|nr:hypothetical protein I551_7908 [Mycobacterium ulcerans str. Harvey]
MRRQPDHSRGGTVVRRRGAGKAERTGALAARAGAGSAVPGASMGESMVAGSCRNSSR